MKIGAAKAIFYLDLNDIFPYFLHFSPYIEVIRYRINLPTLTERLLVSSKSAQWQPYLEGKMNFYTNCPRLQSNWGKRNIRYNTSAHNGVRRLGVSCKSAQGKA